MKTTFICGPVEGGRAILHSADGLEAVWPEKLLPPGTKTGTKLEFFVSENGVGNKTLAKEILNEILDIQDSQES